MVNDSGVWSSGVPPALWAAGILPATQASSLHFLLLRFGVSLLDILRFKILPAKDEAPHMDYKKQILTLCLGVFVVDFLNLPECNIFLI